VYEIIDFFARFARLMHIIIILLRPNARKSIKNILRPLQQITRLIKGISFQWWKVWCSVS